LGSIAAETDAGTGRPWGETQVATTRAAVRCVRSQINSESGSDGGVGVLTSQSSEPALTTRTPTVEEAPVPSASEDGAPKAAEYRPPTWTITDLSSDCVGAS
jgi:hypothetical protein